MASQEQSLSPQYNPISPNLSPDYASSISQTSPPKIIHDSQTPEFLEKLNEYYHLKHIYESTYKDKKNSILKDSSLNIKQKKNAILKIKRNCISCKRPVGTIFQSKDNFLYAICGNKSNPCKLNIKINRGLFESLPDLIDIYQEGIDDNKIKIIKSKLDLLFNFKTENEIITLFNTIKNELNEDLEALLEYKTSFIDITENITNKHLIDSKMIIIYDKINLIKETMKQFNETGEIQFIKDILQIYSDLIPIIHSLKNLKYKYYSIEPITTSNKETIYHLFKKKFTLQDLLIPFEYPSIDSFIFGEQTKDIPISTTETQLDFSKLQEPQQPEQPQKDLTPTFKLKGNKLMFGDKIIADKMDFEANKTLLETLEEISPVMAHNKGYKFEMLYTRPNHPELFAIDPQNGNIYAVDVTPPPPPLGDEDSTSSKTPPPPPLDDEDSTPSKTPPQIQLERATLQGPHTPSTSPPKEDDMELIYDSDDKGNIGD